MFQLISTFQAVNFSLALLLCWLTLRSYIILFTCVLYRLVQFPRENAYTTTFSWFHFWAKWIILQHLLVYFSGGKKKPIKRNENFVSPIKTFLANVLDSFVKEAIQFLSKRIFNIYIIYIHILCKYCFTNICANKDVFTLWFMRTNSWMHSLKLAISCIYVLILGGWYRTRGRLRFILTEKWANQKCEKVKIHFFTCPQVHKCGDRKSKTG